MAEAKHKLDIFKLLQAADLNKRDFYKQLSDEERDDFKPLVAMKWLSSVNAHPLLMQHYAQMTNQFVNLNFWELRDHPELQWMLMSLVGLGQKLRHQWVGTPPKRSKASKLHAFVQQWWPRANDLECEILLNQFTKESFTEFAHSTGMTDKDANAIIVDFERRDGKRQVV